MLLVSILMSGFVTAVHAQSKVKGMTVVKVSTREDDRIYFMDALIDTLLPDYIIQAMYNGVPLPLLLQIEVKEYNKWWLDTTLVTVEQHYILHYYPLHDSIRLNNLTSGASSAFYSVDAAFKYVGTIKDFPLIDKEHFAASEEMIARIRLKIDESALPKPLRTEALLGGNWDLASEWKEWVVR